MEEGVRARAPVMWWRVSGGRGAAWSDDGSAVVVIRAPPVRMTEMIPTSVPPLVHHRTYDHGDGGQRRSEGERSKGAGGHAQGRFRPDLGRQARPVEDRGPPLRGLGDVPP